MIPLLFLFIYSSMYVLIFNKRKKKKPVALNSIYHETYFPMLLLGIFFSMLNEIEKTYNIPKETLDFIFLHYTFTFFLIS